MNLKDTTQEYWVQITNAVVPYIRPHYYISNYGRVGSMASGTFKILSPVKDNDGYASVCIHLYAYISDNGFYRRQTSARVNRLVIMSFYPIPENYRELEVNHINSIRDDNRLCNLEWVTPKENTLHALMYGYKKLQDINGEKNPGAKLSENDVYNIIEKAKSGNYTYDDLAVLYNVKRSTIENILTRKAWNHINIKLSDEEFKMIHDKSVQFIHKPFTEDELIRICEFFESCDINNEILYPNRQRILLDCFYSLGLDKKYNFKSKKHALTNVLFKNIKLQSYITSKYNYKFIR